LEKECHQIDLWIHPTIVPFLTVIITKKDGKFRPYVAPVNHNTINQTMVASITSTMLGNYGKDSSADSTHLQDMGTDAGVLFGYNDKVCITL
jgi:hypothetical protein